MNAKPPKYRLPRKLKKRVGNVNVNQYELYVRLHPEFNRIVVAYTCLKDSGEAVTHGDALRWLMKNCPEDKFLLQMKEHPFKYIRTELDTAFCRCLDCGTAMTEYQYLYTDKFRMCIYCCEKPGGPYYHEIEDEEIDRY